MFPNQTHHRKGQKKSVSVSVRVVSPESRRHLVLLFPIYLNKRAVSPSLFLLSSSTLTLALVFLLLLLRPLTSLCHGCLASAMSRWAMAARGDGEEGRQEDREMVGGGNGEIDGVMEACLEEVHCKTW